MTGKANKTLENDTLLNVHVYNLVKMVADYQMRLSKGTVIISLKRVTASP
jgi:hypothetical protein